MIRRHGVDDACVLRRENITSETRFGPSGDITVGENACPAELAERYAAAMIYPLGARTDRCQGFLVNIR